MVCTNGRVVLTACVVPVQDVFPSFFQRVLALRAPTARAALAQHEATAYLLFMINAFQSLEEEMVRAQVRTTRGGGGVLEKKFGRQHYTDKVLNQPTAALPQITLTQIPQQRSWLKTLGSSCRETVVISAWQLAEERCEIFRRICYASNH